MKTMNTGMACAAVALLTASSAASAGTSLESQVESLLKSKLNSRTLYFSAVKSDAAGRVCGLLMFVGSDPSGLAGQGTGGDPGQRRFLADAQGRYWIQGMSGETPGGGLTAARAEQKHTAALDLANNRVWRACHA